MIHIKNTHRIVNLKNSVNTHKVSATKMAAAYALKQNNQLVITYNLDGKTCASVPNFHVNATGKKGRVECS